MPAIQLARLKIQASELVNCFDDPIEFKRRMHNLFDLYSDRSYHPGQAGSPAPLLSSYHIPLPVFKEVIKQVSPIVNHDRQASLNLVDVLWSETNLEFRQVAIYILGQIEPAPPTDIIQRLETWIQPITERRLIQTIFSIGLARIRQEIPDLYLKLVKDWLRAQDVFHQQMGLKGLGELVKDPSFENIPLLYRNIESLMFSGSSVLRSDLLEIVRNLAIRSPQETAAFLKQALVVKTQNLNSAWLIRHSLDAFPPELQTGLKAALHE